MQRHGHDWALVLAAGEGSRLRCLTTSNGVAVPKQFCSLDGGHSLLEETLQRASVVAARRRTCAIVAEQHRRWWQAPLASLPRENVIVQPENRGTAIGILLPLLRIAQRDPEARLVLLPSDHYVRDEDTLAAALCAAAERLARHDEEILLLGMQPDEPDPELGYVLPSARPDEQVHGVERFVEKPAPALAARLVAQGAVWNSFILAARVPALLGVFERRQPGLLATLREALARDAASGHGDALVACYRELPTLDFSRDLLEGEESHLRVLTVPACGWSDLGTPPRVAAALRRLHRRERPAVLSLGRAILDGAAQPSQQPLAG